MTNLKNLCLGYFAPLIECANFIFGFINFALISGVKLYQLTVSPLLGPCCRFEPTCSQYAIDAFRKHFFIKALYLTAHRVMRCHPGCRFGYDPVPEPKKELKHVQF